MLEGFRFSGRKRIFQIGLDLRRLLAEDKGKLLMEHLFGGFPAAKLGGADGSAPVSYTHLDVYKRQPSL